MKKIYIEQLSIDDLKEMVEPILVTTETGGLVIYPYDGDVSEREIKSIISAIENAKKYRSLSKEGWNFS